MPVLRINTGEDAQVQADALTAAAAALAPGAPVIALVHGYSYTPGHPDRCPHDHILALHPRTEAWAMSWPQHLGFGRVDAAEGLCLAFGWKAGGTIWHAHAEARQAGRALARAISVLRASRPVPVHLLGHSLGARVALAALRDLPEGAVGRAILLAGADTRASAEAALASPAGRTADVVNVLSRENTVFDLLFRAAIHPHHPFARTLGAGLGRAEPRWLDLSIDSPETRAHLADLGFPVPPPNSAMCHGSAYLRPGLLPLYHALLRDELPLSALRPIASGQCADVHAIAHGLPA